MFRRASVWTVTLGILVGLALVQCQDDADWNETSKIDGQNSGAESTTENEIPVFPSTSPNTNSLMTQLTARARIQQIQNKNARNRNSVEVEREASQSQEDTRIRHSGGQRRNLRLLKFLRHFRLDFSKFDSTCMKRAGRGLPAPPVTNAHVFRYTRRRNRAGRQNRYAMVLYECNDGFSFPPESADRMFCSRNKWVGPTPVCLPKGSIHETECSKCEQICSVDANRDGAPVLCSCYAGYEMLNGTCLDIDECLTGNGGCSGICFNKPGSFQCFCPSGFQVGPDGKNCIDRNECLLRNGHGPCQDSCTNTVGAYSCSCERIPGTKLSTDKHSCEDVNECEEETRFGCSHTCINSFGTAFCSCPKGLTLSTSDYKTCLSEDGLLTAENLLEAPVSGVLNTGVECPPGSEPDAENPQICVEHEDCSVENGGCDHLCIPSGSFRFCSCRSGYELLNETNCRDINECEQENGGCDQKCVNTPGSYSCSCKKGYRLEMDERTCKAKYCDEPPSATKSATWECVHPDGRDLRPGEKRVIGAQCRLSCRPGYALASSAGSRNEYEYVNTEPQAYQLVRFDIVTRSEVEGHKLEQITCEADGNWSPRELLHSSGSGPCLPSTCAKLPEPENGSIFPETCIQEGVPLSTQCLVLCSSGFYPKNGKIRTCSKGLRWFPEDSPACIRLPPTPRPYIHCPSDVVVDLRPGQSSAYAKIPQPQANMDWFRYVEADPPWAKNLEWEVPAGVTQVAFTARSPVSNDTATCHFKIHVVDREAPRVQGCPTSFEIRLSHGESSREVWWSEPKFSDNVKLHYVQQTHSPGHLLSRGTHHISYVAGDAEANKARCSFAITVHSADEYEMADLSYYSNDNGRHVIICPNMKTGRWSLHYAYHLPPGCRYHSQGLFSKLFKQNTLEQFPTRVNRRARMLMRT